MPLDDMMTQLRERGGESPFVEVKSAAGGVPDNIAETISAFANMPDGGTIILGLDERREFAPVGLRDPATVARTLANKAREAVEPPVQVDVVIERVEGAHVVVATVRPLSASERPCVVRRSGKAYLRFADGDFALSQLEIDAMIANRHAPDWDEQPVPQAAFDDLEQERVEDFVATARRRDARLASIKDDRELLVRAGVIVAGAGPSLAGLIALGTYPQQFLPHINIRAASLPDRANTTLRTLDDATLTGSIAAMLEDATAWTARNSRTRLVEQRTGSVRDVLDPPAVAVRELIANALVHRDLGPWAKSRAVELRISPDEFRITNPGGLFGVTTDRLGMTALTSTRNRRLLEVCKFVRTSDGRVVEALASGIPAVLAALADADMAPPRFFDQGIAFTAIVERGARRIQPELTQLPTRSAAELAAWNALATPSTAAAIAETLGISVNAAHKRINRLRSLGLVEVVEGSGGGTESIYGRRHRELGR
jgi:ATP-dependent DNA helicase RecG